MKRLNNSPNGVSMALGWLSHRALSQQEIRDRLYQKGFEGCDVTVTISRLKELEVVNDYELAQRLFVSAVQSGKYGPGRILAKLYARGIPSMIIDEIWQTADQIDWKALAIDMQAQYDIIKPDGQRRYIRHLARQGFSSALIASILEGLHGGQQSVYERRGIRVTKDY